MIGNKKKNLLLSVIIPINKLQRDYDNLRDIISDAKNLNVELIFVLDTSEDFANDNLSMICQNYKLHYYKIIKNDKRNPGSSKNIGISIAIGEWIIFCDSDDYPSLKTILELIPCVHAGIDIVIGTYQVENLQNSRVITLNKDVSDLNWESISITPGLWRWLIRRELLADIFFPELSMGEDQCFIIRLLTKVPRVEFSLEIFYKYRTGVLGSLTSNKNNLNDLNKAINLELLCKPNSRQNLRIRNQMIIKQIFTLILRGNFKIKIIGLIQLLKIIFIIPPSEYFYVIRYISLILMKVRVIRND